MSLDFPTDCNKMEMVEVFKTNIIKQKQAKLVLAGLLKIYPSHKINFDLSDCDKILRVEGDKIKPGEIICLLNLQGYQCEDLPV